MLIYSIFPVMVYVTRSRSSCFALLWMFQVTSFSAWTLPWRKRVAACCVFWWDGDNGKAFKGKVAASAELRAVVVWLKHASRETSRDFFDPRMRRCKSARAYVPLCVFVKCKPRLRVQTRPRVERYILNTYERETAYLSVGIMFCH